MTILAALNCPDEVDILGLTTMFGNVTVDDATRNALTLLEIAGRTDIAVARGAAVG